jgi:3-oxoacyl-[acyl-carrier-protein] synthase-3
VFCGPMRNGGGSIYPRSRAEALTTKRYWDAFKVDFAGRFAATDSNSAAQNPAFGIKAVNQIPRAMPAWSRAELRPKCCCMPPSTTNRNLAPPLTGMAGPSADLLRPDPSHSQATLSATGPQSTPSRVAKGRLATLTGVQILATGSYAPAEVVRNEDLAPLGFDADWIVQRTGIRERRRAAPHEATSDLAYEAAIACLSRAGVKADEVDLIVLATMSGDSPTPSTACRLQHRLGVSAPAFDVSAACAGFMYALVTGMQFVKTGCAQRALVVGADVMSRTVNPADKKTYPLFGDGAGAVLLGPGSEDQGFLSYLLGADGSGAELLQVEAGGSREPISAEAIGAGRQFMQMDGRAVFKWAVRMVVDSVREAMAHARLTTQDIDLLVLHQANRRIIDAAANDLGIDSERVIVNLDRFGNTSAGSIPLVLDELAQAGRLHRGSRVLTCGFGAGLAWGAGVFQW